MAYRESRNIEASFIAAIEAALTNGGWTGVSTVKAFQKAYDTALPVICVRQNVTVHDPAEVGSTATYRTATILVDIFATSIGQAEDLKDFLISSLKGGFVYSTIIVTNNVAQKTTAGRITITKIIDTPVNLGDELTRLDVHDRYRWLLSFQCKTNKYEA